MIYLGIDGLWMELVSTLFRFYLLLVDQLLYK